MPHISADLVSNAKRDFGNNIKSKWYKLAKQVGTRTSGAAEGDADDEPDISDVPVGEVDNFLACHYLVLAARRERAYKHSDEAIRFLSQFIQDRQGSGVKGPHCCAGFRSCNGRRGLGCPSGKV